MNKIYKISQSLKSKYAPKNTNLSFSNVKDKFLSESIIPTDIMAISGQGATLQTNKGKLTDLASMTVNCILGQNDPWVNANLVAYLLSERPSFLTTRLGSEYYYKVARRICDATKMDNPVINHRQCNGTDVVELAIIAAYKHRKKGQDVVGSFNNSYHGQGLTAFLISGLQKKHKFLIQESPVIFLDQPDHAENIVTQKLTPHDKKILDQLYNLGDKIFAVIIEPIQVNNGGNAPSIAFMKKLKRVCIQKKIALIFDEVQTGFGWLGTMTAAERYGVWPDLMALSKALTAGNGPLAVLVSHNKYKDLPDGTGAKTNGADIRSLVASNAVMDRLIGIRKNEIPNTVGEKLYLELKKGLLSVMPKKSSLLLSHLKELQSHTKGIVHRIKGDGLIRPIEIVNKKGKYDSEITKKIQIKLLENGILVRQYDSTLIFKPPIVITDDELAIAFEKIHKVMNTFI